MARKNTRNTKQRIVSAAWKLFYEQGFDNTTIEDIVFAETELIFIVRDILHAGEDEALLVLQIRRTAIMHEDGRIVAGADVGQLSVRQIQDPHPQRDEHVRVI